MRMRKDAIRNLTGDFQPQRPEARRGDAGRGAAAPPAARAVTRRDTQWRL